MIRSVLLRNEACTAICNNLSKIADIEANICLREKETVSRIAIDDVTCICEGSGDCLRFTLMDNTAMNKAKQLAKRDHGLVTLRVLDVSMSRWWYRMRISSEEGDAC